MSLKCQNRTKRIVGLFAVLLKWPDLTSPCGLHLFSKQFKQFTVMSLLQVSTIPKSPLHSRLKTQQTLKTHFTQTRPTGASEKARICSDSHHKKIFWYSLKNKKDMDWDILLWMYRKAEMLAWCAVCVLRVQARLWTFIFSWHWTNPDYSLQHIFTHIQGY